MKKRSVLLFIYAVCYGQVSPPVVDTQLTVTISCEALGEETQEIYYTTDGTEPVHTDPADLYTGPFTVNTGTEIRAKCLYVSSTQTLIASEPSCEAPCTELVVRPGHPTSLQWWFDEVISAQVVPGPAALYANKTIETSRDSSLVYGMNQTPIPGGLLVTYKGQELSLVKVEAVNADALFVPAEIESR